jgi:hypothetical protein
MKRRRLLIGAGIALSVVTGYSIWANTVPYTLHTAVEIEATPQEVWTVLTDLPSYEHWNPFIVASSGDVKPGATLTNTMRDASGESTFTPTVLTAHPGRELRWLGRVTPGGIFTGEHLFRIEQVAPNRVRLTQTERFTGVLVPFYRGHLRDATLPQFHAMNHALAERITVTRPPGQ